MFHEFIECYRNLNAHKRHIPSVKYKHANQLKNVLKGVSSRLVHLEKLILNFSRSSFAIRVNLLHPSLLLYCLLLSLLCFSILVNYYF